MLNCGLIFETLLAVCLSYAPGLNTALRLRPLNATWWFTGMPFSLAIFIFDETRRYFLRRQPGGRIQFLSPIFSVSSNISLYELHTISTKFVMN